MSIDSPIYVLVLMRAVLRQVCSAESGPYALMGRLPAVTIGNRISEASASESVQKVFGKELSYYDMDEPREENVKYLPLGSEGSLQKTVWENPDRSCTDCYTVTIFGDLRDHDSTSSIIKWFEESLDNLPDGWWIRQATITVNNEWNGTENWTYKRKE